MAHVCLFHGSEQGVPEGSFPISSNWSANGCDGCTSSDEFLGCFSGIPLDTSGTVWPGEDNLPNSHWELPLLGNAF